MDSINAAPDLWCARSSSAPSSLDMDMLAFPHRILLPTDLARSCGIDDTLIEHEPLPRRVRRPMVHARAPEVPDMWPQFGSTATPWQSLASYMQPLIPPSGAYSASVLAAFSPVPHTFAAPPPGNGPRLSTIHISRINANVHEQDLVNLFAIPPKWPEGHPMVRLYRHIQKTTRSTWPVPESPVPYRVHSAVIINEKGFPPQRIGYVHFCTGEDAERALIEMQQCILAPQEAPWSTCRLRLSDIAPQQAQHVPPPPPVPMMPTVPAMPAMAPMPPLVAAPQFSAPESSRQAQRGRGRHHRRDPHTENVPTVLTFVDNEGGDSEKQPGLASALTIAHKGSAVDPTNTTVFVGSLVSMATESMLYSLFAPYGKIVTINIPRGQDCGFVQFARKSDAANAIIRMQNYPHAGGMLRLSWGRSMSEKAAARAATRAGLRWVEDAM